MKKIIFSFIALGLMTSCLKEEAFTETHETTPDFKVTATINDTETRTQLSEDFKVLWSAGDAISYFNNGKHYRFILDEGGEGKVSASFSFDAIDGKVYGGIETEITKDFYIGVYPFSENNKVSKSEDNIVISTVIPTSQEYALNSFGQNASPMVAVNLYTPDFSFKNVGSMLIMPLKGEGVITKATLSSKSKKIAGAVSVTAVANDNWIPTVDVTAGDSTIVLTCVEGVTLSEETATNFTFILAPGTYEANDLVIKFTDSYGNYFTTEITAANTFIRSKACVFGERIFEAQGTEELDLWIKAKASAYMTAERIIPSVSDVDVEGWVKNLKNQTNTKALIEEAITYITLKNYKAAYEVLGGVPGFVKDVKRFEANGTHIQKVDYAGASYLVSMLEGIESINDIQSLLDYLNEFEKVYEASGLKNKLDEELGSIADNFDAYIDAFVDASVNQKPDENLSEEEALAAYKANIKNQLKNSITGWDTVLEAIQKVQVGVKLFGKWIIEPNPSFMKDEVASLNAYLAAANALSGELDNLTTKEAVEEKIKALPTVKIEYQTIGFSREIKPETWLTGAEADYADKIKEQIAGNETLIAATKAALRTAIEEISSKSLVESLETAINEPESTTGMVLNYLFSQESFMETVKASLREIVAEIEEASKDNVDADNVDKKQQAINTAAQNALINARVDAVDNILNDFKAANEANLNNGPWAIFKKVLNWQKCVEVFTELKLLDVYNVLVELTDVVDEMITYDRGAIYYDIEELANYQENVDWWILKFNEDLE